MSHSANETARGIARTVIIRNARTTDAPRIAELSSVLGYPVGPEAIESSLMRLQACDRNVVLVAESSDGRVEGWIHGSEQEILESGRTCEIVGLVVAQDQRGQGLGRRLVEAVEDWAAERGLTQVSVRSNVVRTESHPFYERAGYERVKTQHAYRKMIFSSKC